MRVSTNLTARVQTMEGQAGHSNTANIDHAATTTHKSIRQRLDKSQRSDDIDLIHL